MPISRTPGAPACVEFAQAAGIDPIGTAGHHPRILAVEVPAPWPRDVAEHPDLATVAPVLQATGARLQGLLPEDGAQPGHRRVLHLRRPTGPFRAYDRTEHLVPEDDLTTALAALVAGPGDESGSLHTRRREPAHAPATTPATGAHPAPGPGAIPPVTDVLVCSHGRRDACCGRLGTQLTAGVKGTPTARIWRTTHTGGHRFAPTALVLPEGTAWAYLDAELLAGILDRSLDVEHAGRLYRGCTGLDSPAVQAAERQALLEVGWSWLDHHRSGRILGREGDRTHVRLEHTTPGGRAGAFEATVEVSRLLPVPECRRPLDEARKQAPELRVTRFGRVRAQPPREPETETDNTGPRP